MKTTMIGSALTLFTLLSTLLLSGCSSTVNTGAVQGAASLNPQATASLLVAGKVYCPPFYSQCGSYQAQGRPRMGGDIIPTLVFIGDKVLDSSLVSGFSHTHQQPKTNFPPEARLSRA